MVNLKECYEETLSLNFNLVNFLSKRQLVRNEINDFLEADSIVNIDNDLISLSNRLNPSHVPVIGPNQMLSYNEQFKSQINNSSSNARQLVLSEIMIIGNCNNQVIKAHKRKNYK